MRNGAAIDEARAQLRTEPRRAASLHVLHRAAEKIDDLVQFSVSDDYGKLRRALGIARVG